MDFSGLLGGMGGQGPSGILGGFQQNAQGLNNNPMFRMGMGMMNGQNPQAGMMGGINALRQRQQQGINGGLLGQLMRRRQMQGQMQQPMQPQPPLGTGY
jgi:hypothetical protein